MNTDRRSAGWVSTLLALVVLVVVGFLCGALAGFLWEEPGLVLAYLSGKTEPVEWTDAQQPGDVAAEPPSYSKSADLAADATPKPGAEVEMPPAPIPVAARAEEPPPAPAPAKPVEKKSVAPAQHAAAKPGSPKPEPVKVAAVTPAGRFSVQVGAFADRASADKLVSRLRAHGYDTFVKADSKPGGKRFRVRVGPVNARARAEELRPSSRRARSSRPGSSTKARAEPSCTGSSRGPRSAGLGAHLAPRARARGRHGRGPRRLRRRGSGAGARSARRAAAPARLGERGRLHPGRPL